MDQPTGEWVRHRRKNKHRPSRPNLVLDLLPFVAMGVFVLAVVGYLIYCHVTAVPPGAPHPTAPHPLPPPLGAR